MNSSKFLALACSLLIAGCAGLRYPADQLMTGERAQSLKNDVSLRVPMGWFNSTDSKAAPGILIWLVKKDYSASITLTAIQVDEVGSKQLKNDGLHAVAEISMSLKKEIARQEPLLVGNYENFSLANRQFCAYEYTTDKGKTRERVVVFQAGRNWYELSAVPFAKKGKSITTEDLFSVQNSILPSIDTIAASN